MPRLSVVVSQGQSANPAKRQLEEDIVAALLFEKGVELAIVPHLYDLKPDGTGMLALEGIRGEMVVVSWLYPRAAHWILDRNGIKGQVGKSLLEVEDADEDDEFEADGEDKNGDADETDDEKSGGIGSRDAPNRRIYCLDLRTPGKVEAYVEEIKRIAAETSVKTVDLMGFIGGQPQPEQLQRFLQPSPGNVDSIGEGGNGTAQNGSPAPPTPTETVPARQSDEANQPIQIEEDTARRWYPVIDYNRCTNCLECLDFCLFGVYGIDRVETILVEQPDNCRKGCPACSRVCPANAIIFPQHKTPAISGSPEQSAGGFKIDLSKLFGAPDEDPLKAAVRERDEQLVYAGRDAVGANVGIPKRQEQIAQQPKDDLDALMDELDELDL